MQQNVNSPPAMVKSSVLSPLTGRINVVSVRRFVHLLDNYFRIVELADDVKIG